MSDGILQATKGLFAGKAFYVEPNLDVLNRVQFRVITWQGKSNDDGDGGWWHFDSIVHDRDGITVYTEVTEMGAGVHAKLPWSKLDEGDDEDRRDELADEDRAWRWVSAELIEPLGLQPADPKDIPDSEDDEFRQIADDAGFAKFS